MENSIGMSQSQDTNSALTQTTQEAVQKAPVNAPDERTFRQSEVNDIVKRAKYGAVEDYKRLQSEQPDYASQKYSESQSRPDVSSQKAPGNTYENDFRRVAAEEAQRYHEKIAQDERVRMETEYAQRTVQNFWNKVLPGREDKYQDFDKVVGDIELRRFPNVVQILSEHVDNAQDVYYELGKDRFKLAQLEQLAYMSPSDAKVQALRLSQSLKDNDAAGRVRVPNEPLSQMRPSNTGTDNGVMSVKDYRSKYKI